MKNRMACGGQLFEFGGGERIRLAAELCVAVPIEVVHVRRHRRLEQDVCGAECCLDFGPVEHEAAEEDGGRAWEMRQLLAAGLCERRP